MSSYFGRTENNDNTYSQNVQVKGSSSKTVQTHDRVNVPLNGNNTNTDWILADGFTQLCVTMKNDAFTSSQVNVLWSNDGITQHGLDDGMVPTASVDARAANTRVKAKYFKLQVFNKDAAAAHVMSCWAYLTVN